MISKKQITTWDKKIWDINDEIHAFLANIESKSIAEMENIPGYDVRLHQHIESIAYSLKGIQLLMDQINCDIKTKKYTGEM